MLLALRLRGLYGTQNKQRFLTFGLYLINSLALYNRGGKCLQRGTH
jgi:hypothetical protein